MKFANILLGLFFVVCFIAGWALTHLLIPDFDDDATPITTNLPNIGNTFKENDILVGFISDDGYNNNSQAVHALLDSEGVDIIVHAGDLHIEKENKSVREAYKERLTAHGVPFVGVPGNHDYWLWAPYGGFKYFLLNLSTYHGLNCTGNYGIKSVCKAPGITFVQAGVKDGDLEFIKKAFENDTSTWRFCIWHQNQFELQVGGKPNDVGYDPYDLCREYGAIIINGHTHTYARTYLMSDYRNLTRVRCEIGENMKEDEVVIMPGWSFVTTPSLGGKGLRGQNNLHDNFASVYTSNQSNTYGALFCRFFNNTTEEGHCYFKNINGEIIDDYKMLSLIRLMGDGK